MKDRRCRFNVIGTRGSESPCGRRLTSSRRITTLKGGDSACVSTTEDSVSHCPELERDQYHVADVLRAIRVGAWHAWAEVCCGVRGDKECEADMHSSLPR